MSPKARTSTLSILMCSGRVHSNTATYILLEGPHGQGEDGGEEGISPKAAQAGSRGKRREKEGEKEQIVESN